MNIYTVKALQCEWASAELKCLILEDGSVQQVPPKIPCNVGDLLLVLSPEEKDRILEHWIEQE